jgi:hypothetical protein
MKAHIVKFVLGAIAVTAGFSAVVMLLWNALLPDIFDIARISFWQALGLLVLARVFFSGFGGGRFLHGFGNNHIHNNHIHTNRWMKMTLEERKEFMKKHGYFGEFRGCHQHPFDTTEQPEKQD